ncbi:unnamed protein product, partial [Didymodactylos carnosus]
FDMSRELPIDKNKKVEGPRLGSSTERDASSLECDKSVVSVKPKLPPAPSVASISSRSRSIRSTTSKAASRASLVSNDMLESMNKLMIAAMSTIKDSQKEAMSMMKDAQKIQADALLRSFNQQQNASQTQLTPVKTMTSVSTDVPITVVAAANLRTSVVSLPPNLFNSSNSDISQHARSLPLDGENKGEKSKLLHECTLCHQSKIYQYSIAKSDSGTQTEALSLNTSAKESGKELDHLSEPKLRRKISMPFRKRRVRSTSYRKLSSFDSAREGVKSKSKFKPKLVKSRKQKASPSSSPSSDSFFSVDDTEISDKEASKPEKKEKNRKKKAPTRKQISSSDDSESSGKEITSESRKKRKSKFSSSSSGLTVSEQAATLQVTVNDSISRFGGKANEQPNKFLHEHQQTMRTLFRASDSQLLRNICNWLTGLARDWYLQLSQSHQLP